MRKTSALGCCLNNNETEAVVKVVLAAYQTLSPSKSDHQCTYKIKPVFTIVYHSINTISTPVLAFTHLT